MSGKTDHTESEKKARNSEIIEKQLENFRKGFPFINLVRHAGTGDGILELQGEKRNFFLTYFDQHFRHYRMLKFVPASGAASRMFKKLFEFLDMEDGNEVPLEKISNEKTPDSVYQFITNIRKFAFYEDLDMALQSEGTSVDKLIEQGQYKKLIRELLLGTGMSYAQLPKALLKFHKYQDGSRVAAEEHLVEAAHYSVDACRVARIHFTVSPEHISSFNLKLKEVTGKYSARFNSQYEISYSVQQSSTDTIAVDMDNNPLRNADGSLVFRPAGHGALLQNLAIPDADIIFIKNIDNVVPDRLKSETYIYKRLIGGYLLWIKKFVHDFLLKAENGSLNSHDIADAIKFSREHLMLSLPEGIDNLEDSKIIEELKEKLDRPIRVCGMVKNEGEPGGGPFWVRDKEGNLSLQIVESAQVDMKNDAQKKILEASTHFNPVDIVCCIKNYKGHSFNLNNFVDETTGLISVKSSGGREIKAQELPGLWNGSMAGWITVFIEVPVVTFNPVKTINDLLRDEHQ